MYPLLIHSDHDQNLFLGKMKFNLAFFPKFIAGYSSILVVLTYVLIFYQGRMVQYIPTFSEAGTGDTNKFLFLYTCTTIPLLTTISMFLILFHTSWKCNLSFFHKFIFGVTISISGIGFPFIAIYPYDYDLKLHYIAAFLGVGFMWIFEHIIFFTVGLDCTKFQLVFRIFLHIIQYICISLFFGIEFFFPNNFGKSISSIGEFCFLVSFYFYNLTFLPEFKRMYVKIDFADLFFSVCIL